MGHGAAPEVLLINRLERGLAIHVYLCVFTTLLSGVDFALKATMLL